MKQIIVLSVGCLMLLGCSTLAMVEKEIRVKKDANGKIIETIEIEKTTQHGTIKKGVQFDYLKIKKDDSTSPAITYDPM